MVLLQTAERGAVELPIVLAQIGGFGQAQAQFACHEFGHAAVDEAENAHIGTVQGVV